MLKIAMIVTASLLALSSAAQAEDPKIFRIGLIGGENEADRLRNYQCLADDLKTALGFEDVKLFPASDYDAVIQGLLGGTLDYAEIGASGYAKTYLKDPKAVEPILTTIQVDGSMGYYSIMVARKDSGMTKATDMKGKKLGFSDPDSTAGYLIPLATLPAAFGGVPVKDYVASTGFGGGHENLILEILKGTFDAGTTYGSGIGNFKDGYTSGNLRKMVDKGVLNMDDLVELWRSPMVPNSPLVVRSALSADLKARFKAFMLALPTKDRACFSAIQGGDFKGYTEVNSDFYKPIIDARKTIIGG